MKRLQVALLFVLAACSGQPGSLRADSRVRIQEPKPGSTVVEPVVVKWSSTFEPGAASGLWFVVYVDAAMTPPGQNSLVWASERCATVPECLERGGINGPVVFLTDGHSIDLGSLPPGAGPEHRLSITLVNEQGIRQGDVAWNASFRIERS